MRASKWITAASQQITCLKAVVRALWAACLVCCCSCMMVVDAKTLLLLVRSWQAALSIPGALQGPGC